MPRREDLQSILVIGSGPIVIGQGCEFDYSGTQAIKALKDEGFRVVLVNSNPATIMTDPELVDATYIEPITPEFIEQIIIKEKPDAILPTVGGQVALNAALELSKRGILKKHNVQLIGAREEAIEKAEDRELFKQAMEDIQRKTGLQTSVPKSHTAKTIEEAEAILEDIGLPMILRPAFTLGGSGGGIIYNAEEFREMVRNGLQASPISQILLEESLLGWKEYELEIMRDRNDNVVVICSIENIDPMGVHTGDSITVAPQQTLTDREYQELRDMSIAIIREIGVDTGGCNIQFAVNPANGKIYVIEMNPRVSRSSALASKATGFPIAKIAARLAIGYTLDEIQNDITRVTPSSFEPTIDYVVTKYPRWNFEKFEGADTRLGSAMKAVGEAMSIGRTLKESLQKCMRSLEIERGGFGADGDFNESLMVARKGGLQGEALHSVINNKLTRPSDDRFFYLALALRAGFTVEDIARLTGIDLYFLNQMNDLHVLQQTFKQKMPALALSVEDWLDQEENLSSAVKTAVDTYFSALNTLFEKESDVQAFWFEMKRNGFTSRQMAWLILEDTLTSRLDKMMAASASFAQMQRNWMGLLRYAESAFLSFEHDNNHSPAYKLVDTCAGEFESYTPYLYSTWDQGDESGPTNRDKVIILGGGPNRIGQGIEFDYCCCHASYALQENRIESILINSNPETVSTDYDTSDRLYFEPMTLDDVMAIVRREEPRGVIIQFGGQTPLRLAKGLSSMGVQVLGTPVDAIDRAEDRERFHELITRLKLKQPPGAIVFSREESIDQARQIGFPVLVRPSYVLGGRAMAIVRDEEALAAYLEKAESISQDQPILIDKFLERAIEVDVDALSDSKEVYIGGVMEHIEEAGIHSGDSACCLPPISLDEAILKEIEETTRALALELGVIGLINIQYAIKDNELFVIEVNPRASRTVPFVAKASGIPLAKLACNLMLGKSLTDSLGELNVKNTPWSERKFTRYYVKEAVLPFKKFPGVDPILGPEMKSTGEVMGIGRTPGEAFYKSQLAAGMNLPKKGSKIFLSLNDESKERTLESVKLLNQHGYKIVTTRGTHAFLKERAGIDSELVLKVHEGRPNIVDLIKDGSISLVINTPGNIQTRHDAYEIRQASIQYNLPYITTSESANMSIEAMCEMDQSAGHVDSLQDISKALTAG